MAKSSATGHRGSASQAWYRWLQAAGMLPEERPGHIGPQPRIPYTLGDVLRDEVGAIGWQDCQARRYPRDRWDELVPEVRQRARRYQYHADVDSGRPGLAEARCERCDRRLTGSTPCRFCAQVQDEFDALP